jgi:hypothetical protein
MRIRIVYHDRCFDGAASAALLGRFLQEYYYPQGQLLFRGMLHRPGFRWSAGDLDGDENAIVDFRYAPDRRLDWWFDHHLSAFLSPEDEAHFRRQASPQKVLDVTRASCTGLIADYLRDQFGYRAEGLEDLIEWAEVIDGAKYSSPAAAVELRSAAARLRLVIEHAEQEELREEVVRRLRFRSMEEVLATPELKAVADRCVEERRGEMGFVVRRLERRDMVGYLDVRGLEGARPNRFLPYCVFPDLEYLVTISAGDDWVRISLGTNPWLRPEGRRPEGLVNLAEVAGRYGGGGHAAVAGISLPRGNEAMVEQVREEILQALTSDRRLAVQGRESS